MLVGEKAASKSELVAAKGEAYVVMRCGCQAEEGPAYPQDLMVYPHTDKKALGAATRSFGSPLLAAALARRRHAPRLTSSARAPFATSSASSPTKQSASDGCTAAYAAASEGHVGVVEYLDEKGVIPGDKVFVFWQAINSADRFPFLVKEGKVQCTLEKETKKGANTIKAANVSQVGGAAISIQDESDGKKTFVGGQHLRYTGQLKFFIPKRGYGYVAIDDGFKYDIEGVPKEIRVEHSEVNCGGQNPGYMKEVQVEFGIWQTQKGAFKAYNMTSPGGTPLPIGEKDSPEDKA